MFFSKDNGFIFGQYNGNQMHFLTNGNLSVTADDWTNIDIDYLLGEWDMIPICSSKY